MMRFRLTLHMPDGTTRIIDLDAGECVVGSGLEAGFRIEAEGIAERHLLLDLAWERLRVAPFCSGVFVNGYAIEGRVEVEFPASVEFSGATLTVEVVEGGGVQDEDSSCAKTDVGEPVNFWEEGEVTAELSGRYRLVKEIARGGMGRIYFGEDPQLKREVAIKVSSMAYGGEDPRFSREAEVLAQLAHPNIVPIHSIGLDSEGRPYYAMKLVKGRTLLAILNAIKKGDVEVAKEYPLSALLTVFRKVCDAMAFAHSKRILHRDLKPENIMVGEYGEVLVMDWGLAKTLGVGDELGSGGMGVAGDIGMTMEGEVMGTPQYMSPEQALGMVAELDERSDIYSLGGVLYALLTLRPPIEGATIDEVLTKVKSGEISPIGSRIGAAARPAARKLAEMERRVPEALRAVTMKAMALERGKRYGQVRDLAADLEAYQNGFATEAEEAGTLKRAWLWVGRNKVLAGSVVMMALVVSGFTAKVVAEGRRASEALGQLKASAPVFAAQAEDEIRAGHFEKALEAATNAVNLAPEIGEHQLIRANVLQVLDRWEEALKAYVKAVNLGVEAKEWVELTGELVAARREGKEDDARMSLFTALRSGGRQLEAAAYAQALGKEFWQRQGARATKEAGILREEERLKRKNPAVIARLIRQLETKLVPVPGTSVLMSTTELTVREWKLYLEAEGYPAWQQPAPESFVQTDDHPVVMVSWEWAIGFCAWLSRVSGKEWRLPKHKEFMAAVGKTTYPWGEHFPPRWDDGNYAVSETGSPDPTGGDGILGTSPVGSFKANALGLYDLGGNAGEWLNDEPEKKGERYRFVVGGCWRTQRDPDFTNSHLEKMSKGQVFSTVGFRVVQVRK